MPNAKPVPPQDSLAAHRAADALPLKTGDTLTVVHLNGTRREVTFDQIWGDKCDQVTVRWGIAGLYNINIQTGQLLGGKPKKKASVWCVVSADLARIHATARQELRERRERMRHP